MIRPSNRELKVLSRLLNAETAGPDDFKDVGDKTFGALLKKKWVAAIEGVADRYTITEKGIDIHAQEMFFGRWKR